MYFSLFLFSSLEIRCDMNIFETTKAKLDSLDVKSYAADLPAGKIRWVDANRNTVAHADCRGIISFAGTNQSYVWISTMTRFLEFRFQTGKPPQSQAFPKMRQGL